MHVIPHRPSARVAETALLTGEVLRVGADDVLLLLVLVLVLVLLPPPRRQCQCVAAVASLGRSSVVDLVHLVLAFLRLRFLVLRVLAVPQ